MIVLKIVLITSLTIVFYQDTQERQVYWIMFPVIALCTGILLYDNIFPDVFYTTIITNILFMTLLILVVYIYSKIKLKTTISKTFGLGDGLLFFALAFSFSSISFLIVFVFGLIFSLLIHLVLNKKSKFITVPLAGYLSLFFGITYLSHWSGLLPSIYYI